MKRKATYVAGLILLVYEAMIFAPQYTLWFASLAILLIIIGSIQRKNTSYSAIATSIIIHATLIFTLTLTINPFKEHPIALFGSLLTFFLLEPEQQARQIEAQGRNETLTQRMFQGMLLIILLLWYNAINRILGELSLSTLYQIFANVFATSIITFHFQKTIAASFRRREATTHALVASFIIAQITWITALWPFTYLTTAITQTGIILIIWNIIESDMKHMITVKRIIPAVVIAGIAIIGAVLSSPWQL